MEALDQIKLTDWLIIIAMFLGPIASVQVEKFIESFRERKGRQQQIFKVLMATRANRISIDHVASLNIIDVEFSKKNNKEKAVITAWHTLLDQFNKYPRKEAFRENSEYLSALRIASDKAEGYFIDLLWEMSKVLNYSFEKTHLSNGCYAPSGHIELEDEQSILRKGFVELMRGNLALNMNVLSLPQQNGDATVVELLKTMLDSQQKTVDVLNDIISKKDS